MRPLTMLAAAVAALLPAGAGAAEPAAPAATASSTNFASNPAKNAALFDFSYASPGSPVLPLVNVAADQITRVESVRKFGIALLDGSKAAGAGKAIAVDVSPYWLLSSGAVSLESYRAFTPFQRILARAKMAAAASEGDASKNTPSSLVFSLSSKILSANDALFHDDFETCIAGTPEKRGALWTLADTVEAAGLKAVADAGPDGDSEAAFRTAVAAKTVELKPAMEAAYKACVDSVGKTLARRSSVDVGAGLRLNGTPGKFRRFDNTGAIVWATFATGVLSGTDEGASAFRRSLPGLQARGVIHARYTVAEAAFDPATGAKLGAADSGLIAAGIESVPLKEGDDDFRWSLQAGWNRQDGATALVADKDYWRYLAAAQLRVADGAWLHATLGRVSGKGVESDTYLQIGLSFSPSTGPKSISNFYAGSRY